VAAFWEMTLRETALAIDAEVWRLEQERRGRAWLAWHTAALSRTRRLPPLGRLIKMPEAKRLDGDELEKRRAEFEAMKSRFHETRLGKGRARGR